MRIQYSGVGSEDSVFRIQDSGVRSQEIIFIYSPHFPPQRARSDHPTPHTPLPHHPTSPSPHTPHPTPHTPHPTSLN
ncbi:MAG: hypothetical protein LW716_11280 [Microcystis sp. 53602_E8]|nr:hypothetical protein [Microcystis sp. 53602_E8]